VPFSSPDWARLKDPKGSLAFGKELWGSILKNARPSIVITMGGDPTKAVAGILGISNMTRHSVGWGGDHCTARESDGCTLLGFPYPARFGILNSAASAEHLDRWFEGLLLSFNAFVASTH
jgi:hypothetical protein